MYSAASEETQNPHVRVIQAANSQVWSPLDISTPPIWQYSVNAEVGIRIPN
jgi:hypothetical protein